MIDTTLEEARRCPECDEPGVLINTRPAPRSAFAPGTKVEKYECRNDTRCKGYVPRQIAGFSVMPAERYSWFVQINPDGSIPPKGISTAQPKAFDEPGVHTNLAQRARDSLAYLAAQDEGDEGRTHEIGHDLGFR